MLSTLKGWLRRLDDRFDEIAVKYPSRWLPMSRLVLGGGFLILFAIELYRGWFAFFALLAGILLAVEGAILLQRQRRWNP